MLPRACHPQTPTYCKAHTHKKSPADLAKILHAITKKNKTKKSLAVLATAWII